MKKVFKNIQYEKYYKDVLPYIKKDKNQQYFAAILTLGASIFFALFAINPTLSTISKLRREVKDSETVYDKLKTKVNALTSLGNEYQVIKSDLTYVYEAVPDKPDAPTLVALIQSLANENNIKIADISVSPINLSSTNSIKNSPIEFELTGESDYENIQHFISSLIDMQRVISISTISISKSIDTGKLQVALKGSAFYKKE